MKKLFKFTLIPALFAFSACNVSNPPDNQSNTSDICFDIAQSTWEIVDYTPTTTVKSAINIADNKVVPTDPDQIKQVELNIANMGSVFYLLGNLYSNENYVTTNNIAHFNASVTLGTSANTFEMFMKLDLDIENDYVYLEYYQLVYAEGNVVGNSYSVTEINYDFDAKELKSFRMIMYILPINAVDIGMDEAGNLLYYETTPDTDEFSTQLGENMTAFLSESQSVTLLETTFDDVFQDYMDLTMEIAQSFR